MSRNLLRFWSVFQSIFDMDDFRIQVKKFLPACSVLQIVIPNAETSVDKVTFHAAACW